MKTRLLLIVLTLLLALSAVTLLLASMPQFSFSPARAAPSSPNDAVTVWTSHCVVCYRTPGGLVARSLVTLPGGRWYFALGGDRVTLASDADPEIYIDEDVLSATDVQVAVDMDGQAFLVYRDYRPDGSLLHIARPTPSGYRRETVGQSYNPSEFGSPSLVIDSRDRLHLTYLYSGSLYYLYRDEVGWHSPQQLVSSVGAWGQMSLSIDSTDNLHLVFRNQAPQELYYLSRTDAVWSTPVQLGVGFDPQLVVASDDRPHLIFASSSPGMQYAVLDQGAWLTETIDIADASAGASSALVFDSQGNPHVSYLAEVCAACYNLRYAYRDTGGWHIESLTGSDQQIRTALAVGSTGNPYLIYTIRPSSQRPPGELHTALLSNGDWIFDDPAFPFSSPLTKVSTGHEPALAAWQPGAAQAVFQTMQASQSSLSFAEGPVGSEWPTEILTHTLDAQPDLTVDSSGNTHIVYVYGNSLVYRQRSSAGVWTEETICTEAIPPTDPFIALDTAELPAVAYRISSGLSSTIKFIQRGASNWGMPQNLISGTACARPALAFDSVNKAHVATGCSQEVIHLYQAAPSWQSESTAASMESITRVALVLDANDQPIIGLSGYLAEDGVVRSVWKDAGIWHEQSLGYGTLAENSALKLDPSGTPTLLTANFANSPARVFSLRIFSNDQWSTITTIPGFPESAEAAFDISPDSMTYILYYDRFRDDLRLAFQTQVEPPASLALNGAFTGHIGQVYTITASTTPSDVSQPLVYTWEAPAYARVTFTSTFSSSAAFSWDSSGLKPITVTVANAAGSVQAAHTIQIEEPTIVAPESVSLLHQNYAAAGSPVTVTASVLPPTTTLPLEYQWTASEQDPITHTDGLTDTVIFNWAAPGVKQVNLSAENITGEAAGSSSLIIEIPLSGLSATSDQSPHPGLVVLFTAHSNAGTGPVYTWDFGDGFMGTGFSVEHRYTQPGNYTVALTAANHISQMQATLQVTAAWEVYLPLLGGRSPDPTHW